MEKLRKLLKGDWSRQIGLILFIIVISAAIQMRNPKFLTAVNINDLLTNAAVLSILAIGMMMVIITRGIDLSVGATMALAGMITALAVQYNPGLNPFAALLLGTVVGLVCGVVIGFLVVKLGVFPIIATLGMMNAYRGFTYVVAKSNWVGANQMSQSFMGIATGGIFGVNNLLIISIVLYIIAYFYLNHTLPGRQIYAVGSNPDSAIVSGVKVNKTLFSVYAMMGALAGLGGVLWVSKYASAQGNTASGFEMNVIAACVLGGVSLTGGSGTLSGVLLGSLLLGILNNALPLINVSPFWQSAIQGVIILIAVISNVVLKRSIVRRMLSRRKI